MGTAASEFGNGRLSEVALTFVKDLAALAPIWAVLTLVGYGVLRQLYANFYGTLGASPEDVGVDATQALTVAAVPLLTLLVLVAVAHEALRRGRTDRRQLTRTLRASIVALVVVGGTALALWSWWQTSVASAAAYRGSLISSVNIGPVQVLALRAEPVQVTWIGSLPAGATPPVSGDDCFMYLGQANGSVVLFDPGPESGEAVRTLRFPADDVALAVVRGEHKPGQARLASPSCTNRHVVYG